MKYDDVQKVIQIKNQIDKYNNFLEELSGDIYVEVYKKQQGGPGKKVMTIGACKGYEHSLTPTMIEALENIKKFYQDGLDKYHKEIEQF